MPQPGTKTETLYVGTHRRAHRADPADIAFGLYAFRRRWDTGTFGEIGLAETPQPGWIAVYPGRQFLYAVNEVRSLDDVDGGSVSAFRIDPDSGALTPLNSRRTPPMPCHCAVDSSGRWLLVATFAGGSVHLFPIAADGSIAAERQVHRHQGSSVHPRRQTEPHAHAVVLDPTERFLLVPDLGTDRLEVYAFDARDGQLLPLPGRGVALPSGSGPRHVEFSADGRFAYLINEMTAAITVFAFDGDTGGLAPIQSVELLPEGFAGLRSGAAVGLRPDGRFLYATTRSHGSSGMPPAPGLDSLVWFDVDPAPGLLKFAGRVESGGGIPRSFAFDADGRLHVGHQCSGTIVPYLLDPDSGAPVQDGDAIPTPVPVCLQFVTI